MPGVQAHRAVGSPMAWRGTHLRLRLKVDDRMTAQAGDTLDKRALRRELRLRRAAVPAAARLRAARSAAAKLVRLPVWMRAQHVALHLARGSELPTAPLIEHAWRQHKRIYVPRLSGTRGMHLVALKPGTRLRRNRYGILEPAGRGAYCPLRRLDLLLAPLLAFDAHGHRLGAGGGYYDRLLARRRMRRPVCLGWALSLQEIPRVPCDPWDQRLDGIVTEKGLRWPTG
ncbi:5-formyltetrahydrofolate cyclo-ligase [Fontimonas thermophila]|uniref:5-formyltetrahydrofolate cyclo-ligase n=1 Tax=Fontimonas thermophila TaxID=1076937 RepID=A0A1I2J3B7_9GAMM|nr:5-formyltetrahydrofolate cyclo-ligase [Fontimonas thermophila]